MEDWVAALKARGRTRTTTVHGKDVDADAGEALAEDLAEDSAEVSHSVWGSGATE